MDFDLSVFVYACLRNFPSVLFQQELTSAQTLLDVNGGAIMSVILIAKFTVSKYFDCNNAELAKDTWR